MVLYIEQAVLILRTLQYCTVLLFESLEWTPATQMNVRTSVQCARQFIRSLIPVFHYIGGSVSMDAVCDSEKSNAL